MTGRFWANLNTEHRTRLLKRAYAKIIGCEPEVAVVGTEVNEDWNKLPRQIRMAVNAVELEEVVGKETRNSCTHDGPCWCFGGK